jgi:hypothetical protein
MAIACYRPVNFALPFTLWNASEKAGHFLQISHLTFTLMTGTFLMSLMVPKLALSFQPIMVRQAGNRCKVLFTLYCLSHIFNLLIMVLLLVLFHGLSYILSHQFRFPNLCLITFGILHFCLVHYSRQFSINWFWESLGFIARSVFGRPSRAWHPGTLFRVQLC